MSPGVANGRKSRRQPSEGRIESLQLDHTTRTQYWERGQMEQDWGNENEHHHYTVMIYDYNKQGLGQNKSLKVGLFVHIF